MFEYLVRGRVEGGDRIKEDGRPCFVFSVVRTVDREESSFRFATELSVRGKP